MIRRAKILLALSVLDAAILRTPQVSSAESNSSRPSIGEFFCIFMLFIRNAFKYLMLCLEILSSCIDNVFLFNVHFVLLNA